MLAERPTPSAGLLATNLVTQATRQALLAMAQALKPADRDEGLDEAHATVARHAWATLVKLGPVFMRTLPAQYHYD